MPDELMLTSEARARLSLGDVLTINDYPNPGLNRLVIVALHPASAVVESADAPESKTKTKRSPPRSRG